MRRAPLVGLVAVVVAAGLLLRLHGLGDRPMGHVESYTPGIEYPAGIATPPARLTLRETLRYASEEPHPLLWYVAMLGWTKVAGTELVALRLPGVLAGAACILLTYLVGARAGSRLAGVLAAALLAVNGHHVFWSQVARPSTLACLLGLASTLALLRLSGGAGRARGWLVLYLAASLAGLNTSYYSWTLYAAQLLWVLLAVWTRRADLAGLLRTQLALLVVATPTIALAVYQARESYLRPDAVETFTHFFSFGFLFYPYSDAPVPAPWWSLHAVPALGLLLAAVGVLAWRARPAPGDGPGPPGPRPALLVLLTAGAVALVVALALELSTRRPDRLAPLLAVALAPAAAGALALWDARTGALTRRLGALARRLPIRGEVALIAWSWIGPCLLVAAVSAVVPFYAPRHMLILTPFLLLSIASGIAALVALRPRALAVAAVCALALALPTTHVLGLGHARKLGTSWVDYAGAAAAWTPRLRPDDLIFMHRHWVNTPMLYYLRHGDHRYAWGSFEERVRADPGARVWTVTYSDWLPLTDRMRAALEGHRQADVIEEHNVEIRLFVPR